MDIEDLNASQIILLALLVSFVTSIATGIVTVSLMAQAPAAVTNTVNQVVERTIETIVPAGTPPKSVKETTVVVKEEDLITNSIAASFGKTGRIYAGTSTTSPVAGLAIAVSSSIIITDISAASKESLVVFGETQSLFILSDTFPDIGVAVLTLKASSTPATSFRIGDTNAVKLGQTAIAVVSVLNERVAIGAVSAKSKLADIGKEPKIVSVRAIETNIGAELLPGTPLVNAFGDLIGIYAQTASGGWAFVSVSDIAPLILTSSDAPASKK